MRTIAHSVAHMAAKYLIPDFRSSLERMYERALASGWWDDTYAAYTLDSYFVSGHFDNFLLTSGLRYQENPS